MQLKALFFATVMLFPTLGGLAASALSQGDDATLLQDVLQDRYPTTIGWQVTPIAHAYPKRRAHLFSESVPDVVIRRDGNVFSIQHTGRSMHSSYRVSGYQTVLVARRYLPSGTSLSAADIDWQSQDIFSLACDPVRARENLADLRVRRSLRGQEAICETDIEVRPMIARADTLSVRCRNGSVTASVSGVALSEGSRGASIRVRRDALHKPVTATVVDQGEADACL